MQLTLTNRLRLAALQRANKGGRVVGTYVIDNEGVIDLRALEDRQPRSRASDLAALNYMAGMFEDAADVSDLYAPEQDRSRGWFKRRVEDHDVSDHPHLDLDADRDYAVDDQLEAVDVFSADEEASAETPIPASDPVAAGDRIEVPTDRKVASRRLGVPVSDGDEVDDEVVIDLRDDPEQQAPIPGHQPAPSSLQSAIMEFNQLEPVTDSGVVDIDSGIIFGTLGELVEPGRGDLFESEPAPARPDVPGIPPIDVQPPDTLPLDTPSVITPPVDTPPVDIQPVDAPPAEPPQVDDVIDLRDEPAIPSGADTPTRPNHDLGAPAGPIHTPSTPDADQTDGHAVVADPSSPGPLDDRDDQTPAATSGGDDVVCPACGGAATKDFANRFLEIDFYSCNECFNMWHLAAEEDS